jgi:hypothetical protein
MLGLHGVTGAAEQQSAQAPSCRADGSAVPIAELPEASGIAASRTVPGRLWAHNDSAAPELFMLDGRGRITDGDVTPDGEWIALRTHHALVFYRAANLVAGNWKEERVVDLAALREPQGEGVTFGSDGSVYLAGEGGGSGTFARLTCTR